MNIPLTNPIGIRTDADRLENQVLALEVLKRKREETGNPELGRNIEYMILREDEARVERCGGLTL